MELKDFINSVSKFESIISEILLPVGIDDNWISIEDKTVIGPVVLTPSEFQFILLTVFSLCCKVIVAPSSCRTWKYFSVVSFTLYLIISPGSQLFASFGS